MKRRNMMKAVLAAPASPALTLDKSTGRVNGVNFVDRKSKREMHAKARVVVLMGGGGYLPRFKNITAKEKNFIRGCAFDFFAGGTPDAKYFGSWGEQLQKDIDAVRGASVSGTLMGEVLPRNENHVGIDKKSWTPSAFPS